ncbi:MAG: (2Fe-2S)-binding protein [Motiliproteus sp.]|nr:(2Fe-2S)-binding protein [Motiliproteus sp.]MCW9052878.1 (2Fe-2S)-binding protein [Motiliproteus sp.]
MYVCICRGVTSSQIQREVSEQDGKSSVREINERLGCGKDCGRCCSSIKQIIQQSGTNSSNPA